MKVLSTTELESSTKLNKNETLMKCITQTKMKRYVMRVHILPKKNKLYSDEMCENKMETLVAI